MHAAHGHSIGLCRGAVEGTAHVTTENSPMGSNVTDGVCGGGEGDRGPRVPVRKLPDGGALWGILVPWNRLDSNRSHYG